MTDLGNWIEFRTRTDTIVMPLDLFLVGMKAFDLSGWISKYMQDRFKLCMSGAKPENRVYYEFSKMKMEIHYEGKTYHDMGYLGCCSERTVDELIGHLERFDFMKDAYDEIQKIRKERMKKLDERLARARSAHEKEWAVDALKECQKKREPKGE